MRIVSWNACDLNLNQMKGVKYIFSQSPDVICIQEISMDLLDVIMRKYPNYELVSSYTWKFEISGRKYAVAILSRIHIRESKRMNLYRPGRLSFYRTLVYDNLFRVKERPAAICITIYYEGIKINIITTQLSISIRPKERIKQLKNLISKCSDPESLPIICGDLNITGNKLFTRLMGGLIGYVEKDYQIDEVEIANEYFKSLGLNNLFYGSSTCGPKMLKLQFDHILIPQTAVSERTRMLGKKGSDHEILMCDISLK